MEFDVTIEIPKGQRNKYEVDHKTVGSDLTGCFSPPPSIQPTTDSSTTPSARTVTRWTRWCCCRSRPFRAVWCWLARAIGMFRMRDEAGPDDKVLCVPARDPRQEHMRDIHHVPEFERLEIQHFFEVYKDLEPKKSVEGATWVGRDAAEAEIQASYKRLEDNPDH